MSNILIADDHPLFRQALRDLMTRVLPDEENIYFEASNKKELFEISARESLDIVLLDLLMPGMNGLNELVALRNALPSTPVVIISTLEEVGIIRQAINLGAAGYIPKTYSANMLTLAMQSVLAGNIFVPEEVEKLCQGAPNTRAEALDPFTPRQLAVLSLLGAGKSNKEIARELAISDLTVKVHMTTIFRKLGVASRTQAIVAFQQKAFQQKNANPPLQTAGSLNS